MKAKKLPSGNWNVRVYDYTDKDGKKIYKSFTASTKSEVMYQAATYKKKKPKNKADMTVRDAIEKYIELSQMLAPTTLQGYRIVLRNYFKDFMDYPLAYLTDEVCQIAINTEAKRETYRGKQVSPKTIKNAWGLIVPALKMQGYEFNVRLPKMQKAKKELPPSKVVFDAIKGSDVEIPCLLAMTLSLRMSEIKGLQYKHIRDGAIYVEQTLHIVDRLNVISPYTKTDASTRRIKLYPRITELLPGGDPEDFVVPMHRNTILRHFQKLMQEQGYNMTFHDLRHMYASIMLNDLHMPSKLVQIEGGWASPYVMNQIYSNSFTDSQEKMAAAKEDYFNRM